jgi:formyl-CoA transferase
MHLTIAILAVLVQRHSTGRGQLVEVAMQEAVLNLNRVKYTQTLATGRPLDRTGNRLATGGWSDLLRCSGNGSNDYVYITIPPGNPEMFEAMTEVIGRPDLRTDDRFATPPARARNGVALTAEIERWTGEREKREEAVNADWAKSHRYGVTGVPTFVADRYGVVGAQPYEVLEQLLDKAGAKRRV